MSRPPDMLPGSGPWERVVVGVAGPEFESAPPGYQGPGLAWCPDTECDGWSTPALTLRSASVRGDRHRYYRQPRQDRALAVADERTGGIIFAVADGVSSATQAATGAAAACQAAVQALCLLGEDRPPDFRTVAAYAAQALHHRAAALLGITETDPAQVAKLLATTLVAGTAVPGPEGVTVSLFRVGDSCAWLLNRADGSYRPLFGTKTGGESVVVSSTVDPLPRIPQALEQVTAELEPELALVVGTDGFGDPLGDGDGEVGALFARLLAEPPSPPWLAHVLDFSRETFDDDRTLLALWARDGRHAR